MSAHLELLRLCTLHPLSASEQQLIRELAVIVTDWDDFASLAALNKVEPKICMALEESGVLEAVPETPRRKLVAVAARIRETNARRVEQARALFGVLEERGIPVCVLKGVLFGEVVYGDAGYKRMNDVDFLVPRESIHLLPELYSELGYLPVAERVGRRGDLQLAVAHHLPPYVSADLSCVLGTQWGLKSPLLRMHIDMEGMWRRARPFDFRGLPLQQLSTTDNLFHLCVHLGRFKSGLRDVMDIYNLVRARPQELDLELFARLVRDAGAEELVFHALSLANRLCPTDVFAQMTAELAPKVSRSMRRMVAKKTGDLSVLLRICSGYLSEIEKEISELNATAHAPDKLRRFFSVWMRVLAPPRHEARRLCFEPDSRSHGIALRAPASILLALGAELGFPLLGLLAAKMAVDTATTLLNPRAWRRPRSTSLGGLSPADLQQLKDAIY